MTSIQKLKAYMKKHGIQQKEAAKFLCVTPETICRWLKKGSKRKPTPLAKHFIEILIKGDRL